MDTQTKTEQFYTNLSKSNQLFECWVILQVFLLSADFSPKSTFLKNTIRVLNSLDPDQARHFVGPDLRPFCLQRLRADDTSRQRVNPTLKHERYIFCFRQDT